MQAPHLLLLGLLITGCQQSTHFSYSGLRWGEQANDVRRQLVQAGLQPDSTARIYNGPIQGLPGRVVPSIDPQLGLTRVDITLGNANDIASADLNAGPNSASWYFALGTLRHDCHPLQHTLETHYGPGNVTVNRVNLSFDDPTLITLAEKPSAELLRIIWQTSTESLELQCFISRHTFPAVYPNFPPKVWDWTDYSLTYQRLPQGGSL
ncbi:hypothetical protein MF271_22240 (plasmid) [Deinococcus sp. KNUC1210]|uniref:hypothetical protein n=1 Tax=Deinococcus sp. KNUC1210 TaxID=2917691 RepID=UPI001EF15AC5|nr:hypothetical protein [Deinococcus sp. KNUC1210]ULH18193.1 hypothetical protein MF271_22240 [Deinococcus sp. KNUC1210]